MVSGDRFGCRSTRDLDTADAASVSAAIWICLSFQGGSSTQVLSRGDRDTWSVSDPVGCTKSDHAATVYS